MGRIRNEKRTGADRQREGRGKHSYSSLHEMNNSIAINYENLWGTLPVNFKSFSLFTTMSGIFWGKETPSSAPVSDLFSFFIIKDE